MKDLDAQLREILDYCAETYYPLHEYPDQPIYTDRNKVTLDEAVVQVKQAFTDAGYVNLRAAEMEQPVNIKEYRITDGRMTGAEWYEKFKELLPLQPYDEGIYTLEGYIWEGAVLAAARRAAGLEGEQS